MHAHNNINVPSGTEGESSVNFSGKGVRGIGILATTLPEEEDANCSYDSLLKVTRESDTTSVSTGVKEEVRVKTQQRRNFSQSRVGAR